MKINNTPPEKIIASLANVKLSNGEKTELLNAIHAEAPDMVRNDEDSRYLSYTWPSITTLLTFSVRPMAIALVILLFVGGGTSYAAESSLPGDALYPVKVSVNEEVRGWLATSTKAKAEWDAERLDRRLEEAAQLAAENQLNAEAEALLSARIISHSSAAEERSETLEAKGDDTTALRIRSRIEATLEAHEQVLVEVRNETETSANSESATEASATASILETIRTRLEASVTARMNAEKRLGAKAGAELRVAAEEQQEVAERILAEAKAAVEKATTLQADARARAEADLAIAARGFAEGKASIEAEAYGKAFIAFEEASRLAQQAVLIVRSSSRFTTETETTTTTEISAGDDQASTEVSEQNENRDETDDSINENGTTVEVDTDVRIEAGAGANSNDEETEAGFNLDAETSGTLRVN